MATQWRGDWAATGKPPTRRTQRTSNTAPHPGLAHPSCCLRLVMRMVSTNPMLYTAAVQQRHLQRSRCVVPCGTSHIIPIPFNACAPCDPCRLVLLIVWNINGLKEKNLGGHGQGGEEPSERVRQRQPIKKGP